jgi:hypothetical protein
MKRPVVKVSVLVSSALVSSALAASPSLAVGTNITTVTTINTSGSSSSLTGVAGGTAGSQPGSYNLNYAGNSRAVSSFTTASGGVGTVSPLAPATFRVRRNPASDQRENVWYQGTQTGAGAGSTLNLQAGGPVSLQTALSGNNLLVGSDNLLTNTGDTNGNQSNTERLDFVLSSSLGANANQGFTIFERGGNASNPHDTFVIAAITAIDSGGNPAAYGNLTVIPSGWGTSNLVSNNPNYFVFNNSAAAATGAPRNFSAPAAGQNIGGLYIATNELVATGTTVFGYSLFGADVSLTRPGCTQAGLLNVGSACYPSTTTQAQDGLDLVGANLGVVTVVPEPSAMVGFLSVGLLGGWAKRKKSIRSRA